jgi:hypothetical protein
MCGMLEKGCGMKTIDVKCLVCGKVFEVEITDEAADDLAKSWAGWTWSGLSSLPQHECNTVKEVDA